MRRRGMVAFSLPWLLLLTLAAPPLPSAAPEGPAQSDDHHARPVERVGFDEALGLTAARKDLEHERRAVDVRRKGLDEVGRQNNNPQIQLQPGVRVNPSDAVGPELQAQVTQSWTLGGIKQARRETVKTQTEVFDAELRRHALDARLEAAHAWIVLRGLEERLELAEAELATARELTSSLAEALALGASTRAEWAEARQYELEVEQRVAALEGEVHDVGLELARTSGGTPRRPLGTTGPTPTPVLPSEAEIERAFERLETLPAVDVYRLEALAARARGAEAKVRKSTVITAGGAVQLESPGSWIVSGIVGVRLPLVDKNQAARLDASADVERAEAHRDRARRDATADLAQNLHEIEHTRAIETMLDDRRLPALEELTAARQALVDAGEETSFALLESRRRLLAARGELAEVRAERLWQETRMWLLLGELEEAQG